MAPSADSEGPSPVPFFRGTPPGEPSPCLEQHRDSLA